jgi:phage terminase large subunit-like protein
MELGDWDAIDQIEGALWNWEWIEQERRDPNILRNFAGGMGLVHVVVGVDPAGTSNENSDDTGIVVAGRGRDGHYYVLADRTCHLSPDGWGRVAVEAYHEFQADRIVAEVNYGGDMVVHTIRTVDQRVPVTAKNAGARGKRLRAEPISAIYEQRKAHHCGVFEELEEQMTSWTAESGDSPDRLDALVWAMTDLSAGVTASRGKQDRSGVLRGTR